MVSGVSCRALVGVSGLQFQFKPTEKDCIFVAVRVMYIYIYRDRVRTRQIP